VKAHELPSGRAVTFDVRGKDGSLARIPARRSEVELRRVDDEILLAWDGEALPVVGADVGSRALLADVVDGGRTTLIWVAFASPMRVTLHAHHFQTALHVEEALTIGIDDRCFEDLRRRFHLGGTVADAAGWLAERLLIDGGATALDQTESSRRRAVITAGAREAREAFRVLGKGVAVDVRRLDGKLRVDRVLRAPPPGDAPVHLLVAAMSFTDITAPGELAAGARLALDQAVRSAESYLRIWSTYAGLEREAILRRATGVGSLRYDRVERLPNGALRFHVTGDENLEARLAALGDETRFELAASEDAPLLDDLDAAKPSKQQGKIVSARVDRYDADRRTVVLRAPDDEAEAPEPPAAGFLHLSLAGDLASLRRREDAEEKLRTGNCPMPQLGLLLEGRPFPTGRRRRQAASSKAVLDAFGGQPTTRQLAAIDAALNTPDIALIQGPPGTGKTKVITALQRRIAELADEGAEVSHRVLVTSAQHDAVENLVQRSEVFGLPAVKIGSRRDDDGAVIDGVERFRKDRIEHLRATLTVPPDEERVVRARRIAVGCLRAPAPPMAMAASLRDLAATVHDLIAPALVDRLLARVAELSRPADVAGDPEEHTLRMAAARGIRVDATSFLDDGPMKARKALARLSPILQAAERQALTDAADWQRDAAPPWLSAHAQIRDALIDRLETPPPVTDPGVDGVTQKLLTEVIDALEQRRMRSIHGEPGVLAAYLEDLENDPAALREAIEHYTVVLAATCQHASSRAMRAARGIQAGTADFETVIVDEAARVHPLDLFIPMSMAKRRVVLVGDHRQLPHMLEPDVERDVAEAVAKGDLAAEAESALKESLFGRLWELLGALEERDGVKRRVQLDTQYRMHPLLGELVSRCFYEGKLESGKRPESFAHALPGYVKDGRPCVAAWLDVPGGPGRWEQRGRSKSRIVEARRIAKEVRSLIEVDDRLTFGVIALYRAQVDALGKAFCDEGLAERSEAGGFRIAERWRRTTDAQGALVERLRVGTVDAFQGKEFDVVFLSLTRSNDLTGGSDAERRRKYGHLVLDNRLCVAMSRQHRLLVIVGDRDFAVQAGLPALTAFSTLSEGPHGIVRR
jgi:hypothetical protein